VCFIDPHHGCGVFLGDNSGAISFCKVSVASSDNSTTNTHPPASSTSVLQAEGEAGNSIEFQQPPVVLPVSMLSLPSPLMLAPTIIAQQSLYTTHIHSSFRKDNNSNFRLLDMKVSGVVCCRSARHACTSVFMMMYAVYACDIIVYSLSFLADC
jgi:hypothetical protein